MCVFYFVFALKKRKEDEGINVIYKKTYTHSTLDREATVVIAIQSIQKKRNNNNEIYNIRMGKGGISNSSIMSRKEKKIQYYVNFIVCS